MLDGRSNGKTRPFLVSRDVAHPASAMPHRRSFSFSHLTITIGHERTLHVAMTSARCLPLDELEQTPDYDLDDAASVPEYEIDQTVSW